MAASSCRLPMLPNVGDLLRMLRIPAYKRLAQNFLLDMNVNKKIVRIAGGPKFSGSRVCEIGPGPGGITRALLMTRLEQLDVIEIDYRFMPLLDLLKDVSDDRLRIHHENVLKFDWSKLWNDKDNSSHDRAWMDEEPKLLNMMSTRSGPFSHGRVPLTFTFQQEIGVRMAAPIDHVERCRLTICTQYLADVKPVMDMPFTLFVPRPKVDVTLMQVIPRRVPLIKQPFGVVNKLCRHLFHYRQKRIYKPLMTLYPEDLELNLTNELLERTDIPATSRCFELSIKEIGALCAVYAEQCHRIPGLYLYDYRQPVEIEFLSMRDNCVPEPYGFPDNEELEDDPKVLKL